MSKWRPIKSTTPEDGEIVDIWIHEILNDGTTRQRRLADMRRTDGKWEYKSPSGMFLEEDEYTKVTHWMPLPAAPDTDMGER